MKYQLCCDGFFNLKEENLQKRKPFQPITLYSDSFEVLENDKEGFFEGKKRELPLSMVCSGGESHNYSLYFFEGYESKWFLKERIYFFEDLFKEMKDHPSVCSRSTKRIVLANNTGPLFEMMDGKLYLFDIDMHVLIPFFIESMSQIKCIGSGIMSNVIMVQTIDGKILKKNHHEGNAVEIRIKDDTSYVKLFSCYCRDLQIIVLENNRFFVVKDGTTYDSHYGFLNGPHVEPFEVETPFKSGIKKVSSGYGHCIILLENGQVFSKGLNNYLQCCKPDSVDIEDGFYEITSIAHPVIDIECGSICSAFRTRTHFLFFGLLSSEFGADGYWHKIEYEDQQISIAPWHGFIYRNKHVYIGKSELYFINNLKEARQKTSSFCDTLINFQYD